MLRLFKLSELNYKDNDLGLAICNYCSSEHLGLLVKNEEVPLSLYDFIQHKSPFYKGEIREDHLCKFSSYFDEETIMTFNNVLSYILDDLTTNDLPFSIIFSEDIFNLDLSNLMESVGVGFTCTTIILGIFNYISLDLIDTSTWPIGLAEDIVFQKSIVDSLIVEYPQHAEKQRAFIGNVPRFSPSQILIAFIIYMGNPVKYSEIEPYIQSIKDQINQHDLLLETLQ